MIRIERNQQLPSYPIEEIHFDPNIKITSTFNRVIHSRLVLEGLVIASIGAAIVVAATITLGPIGLTTVALVVAGLALRTIYNKKMCYQASIIPTALQKSTRRLGNEIISGCLTLGPIPLKNKFDHNKLLEAKITLVLTMLEEFEWKSPSIFSEPVTPNDWKDISQQSDNSIEQKIVCTPDFRPVALKDVQVAVEIIRKEIQENHGHVYVHCKAGRGRSATAVICYLLRYGKSYHGIQEDLTSVDAAIAYVKARRPEININKRQYQAIVDYLNTMYKASEWVKRY